jgi:Tol biopolymer transport system component
MGEVYSARDTRLERTVAIKVLPSHLSSDPDLKLRFEREARAISSLKHPHICTLHDVGSQDGIDYLVMEYVAGESLADRLKKGPLPIEQALRIALDVADALSCAHHAGIIHRDLKPGNIMLTKDGAKVLDFGLAKITERRFGTPAAVAATQTISTPLTTQGAILGTLQYMAPEQLEGKEADARTDIFAFGCVLYEMVTGNRAFNAKSQASLIAAVLEHEPSPILQVQPLTPRLLDRLIRDCLAKDPEQRRQTAHDVLLDLHWIATAGEESLIVANPRPAYFLPWIAAALAIVLAIILGTWIFTHPREHLGNIAKLDLALAPGDSYGGSWWWLPTLALSPDGSHLAYVAIHDGKTQLYLRAMNEWQGRALPGTADANTPFFSPDGQWLGAIAHDRLIKIPVAGGPPVDIAKVTGNIYGASWAPDGTIYFASTNASGVMKVAANGGTAQPFAVSDMKKGETDFRYPELLPGGQNLLLTVRNLQQPNFDEADIYAFSTHSSDRKLIVKSGTNARYLANGFLVFLRAGVLLAAPFDLARLELKGQPTPVVDGVIENPRIGAGQFAVSDAGTLAYLPGGVTFGDHELVYVDHSGHTRLLSANKRAYEDFSISPDGRFLAMTIEGNVTDSWIHDIARDTDTRFTLGVEHRDPAWTADGKRIAYTGYANGKYSIDWKPLDGGPAESILLTDDITWPWFFSRDGRSLIYQSEDPATGDDLWLLPLEGDRKPRPLYNSPFNEEWAQISPDGHWIVYNSDESGRNEVYVAPFPGPGPKVRVSTGGGRHPQWAPNGRELYYRLGANTEADRSLGQVSKLFAVTFEGSPELKTGTPRLLFEGPFFDSGHDWAVTPDGKEFIFIRETPPASGANQMKVVLNWFEDLARQGPSKNN